MKREDFDAAFKRWNNVPLSDLRGQYNVMLYTLRDGFEKRLPPWKRWMVKSNGRRLRAGAPRARAPDPWHPHQDQGREVSPEPHDIREG